MLNRTLPEPELIAEIKLKSRIGAEALYDMYAKNLFGILIKIIKNKEIAEDALQQTFMRIWDSFDSYDASKARLYTWMLCITRNIAKDTLRSKQCSQGAQTESIDFHLDRVEQQQIVSLNTDRLLMRSWLQSLKAEQRAILDLIYFSGYTHTEVALHLGIPVGTVKTRCRNGINMLRAIYNRLEVPVKMHVQLAS